MKKMTPLGQFIADEISSRHISQNEFAKQIGVNSSTLGKAMRFEDVPEPTISFLNKLAKATGKDVCSLMRLALDEPDSRSARAILIAQRIEALPPEAQELIDRMLLGLGSTGLKGPDETND